MKKGKGQQLIGKKAKIIVSTNKHNCGLQGTIIDETKNTIVLLCEKPKTLLKNGITIKIDEKIIEGNKIKGRPDKRLKKSK